MTSQCENKTSVLTHPDLDGMEFEVGYDNSNPRKVNDLGFEKEKDKIILIINQNLEEGAASGYSFHLNIAIVNKTDKGQRLKIRINWQEPEEYDFCRDYMYIGYDNGREWRMLAIRCANGVTDTEIVVPPGRNLLCCTPKFDTDDYFALLDRFAEKAPFEKIDVAVSAEGRPISCLRGGNPDGKTCIITTRAHGYETAGAHCLSEFCEVLSAETANFAEILERLNLFLFPMINVDAVAHGNCCLAPTGVNFGNELAISENRDSGACELRKFIIGKKPFFYLDMHNNTGPHVTDSFRSMDAALVEKFTAVAPEHSKQQKIWVSSKVDFSDGYLPSYCCKQFGTIPVVTEFPWYTRTVPEMKMHGREFFKTLFKVLINY